MLEELDEEEEELDEEDDELDDEEDVDDVEEEVVEDEEELDPLLELPSPQPAVSPAAHRATPARRNVFFIYASLGPCRDAEADRIE